ncbi:MAG: tRNA dihydrouridine synthase DusB [Candidatus Zixiibacteriota bacterium]
MFSLLSAIQAPNFDSRRRLAAFGQRTYIVGMQIGNLNLSGQVLLAPLAGVSNRPFRVLAARAGATMTFTEMVSSEGIIRHQDKTLSMMAFKPDEQPLGIQLFGADPEVMKQAARITVEKFRPDVVDINFGCPVKKVVNKNGGSAVLRDLGLTEEIIRGVVEGAGETPTMVKIRCGWVDTLPVYREVGQIAQRSGAKAITLHARSRAQGFTGKADWSAIKELKEAVDIAVIGNGDVQTPEDARRMLEETRCDGIMIGRAALGNPFIFGQIRRYFETGQPAEEPSMLEKIEMARLHAQLMAEQFGDQRGAIMMRRYLGWYVKGFPGATELRPALFAVHTISDIETVFADYVRRTLNVEPSATPVISGEPWSAPSSPLT